LTVTTLRVQRYLIKAAQRQPRSTPRHPKNTPRHTKNILRAPRAPQDTPIASTLSVQKPRGFLDRKRRSNLQPKVFKMEPWKCFGEPFWMLFVHFEVSVNSSKELTSHNMEYKYRKTKIQAVGITRLMPIGSIGI
jgi:hypothetical protein